MSTVSVLQSESAKLKRRAAKIDELIAELLSDNEASNGEAVPATANRQEATELVRDLENATHAAACFAVLAHAGRPLSREDILTQAQRRGSRIPNLQALATVLSRDRRFAATNERGVWTLAEDQPNE